MFEVKKLDQLLDGQFKDSKTVGPLVCPSCRRQITSNSNYRYGNLIRQKRNMVRKLHGAVLYKLATKKQKDAFIEKVLWNFLPLQVFRKGTHEKVAFLLERYQERLFFLLERYRQYLPTVFEELPALLLPSRPCTQKSLNVLENEIDQYVLIKEWEGIYKDHPELSTSMQQLLAFFKATPPSAQKTQDVYCEKERIFLLWMIAGLEGAVPSSSKDYGVLMQLKEMLVFNKPALTVRDVNTHFDKLQNIAHRAKKWRCAGVDPDSLKPARAIFINGVWTVCPNGHICCKPRGLNSVDEEMWECPDCPH